MPSVLDHEIQQGFVFTYNKLQGATIDRLILLLCNVTKYKLGDMSIHKLYVALSRVRNRKHLAIFNVKDEDLEYLLKKRYSDRLVAWYGNYDTNGNWKSNNELIFEDVNKLYDDVYKNDGLEKAKVTVLKEICKKLDIFINGKTVAELRNELKESYNAYISSKMESQ